METVADQRRLIELLGDGAQSQRAEAEASGQQVPSAEDLANDVAAELALFDGAGEGTLAADNTANILAALINDEISLEALSVAGTSVTDADRDAARTEVEAQVAESGVEVAEIPSRVLDQIIEQRATRTAIEATAPEAPITSDDEYEQQLRDIYAAQVDQLEDVVCVNVLLAQDEESVTDARSRIEAGESFEALALELSPDDIAAATDGGGGCPARAQVAEILGDEALTAEAGDLVGPGMAADGRFLLAEVDEVRKPAFEELRDQLAEANPNTQGTDAAAAELDAYVQGIFDEATERSEVTVNSIYGSWSAESATVVPPPDPGAAQRVPIEGGAPAPVGAEAPPTGP